MIEIKDYQNEPYLVINNEIMERDRVNLKSELFEMIIEVIDNEVFSEIKRIPFRDYNLEHESNRDITIQYSFFSDIPGIVQTVYLFKESKKMILT